MTPVLVTSCYIILHLLILAMEQKSLSASSSQPKVRTSLQLLMQVHMKLKTDIRCSHGNQMFSVKNVELLYKYWSWSKCYI